VCCSPETQARSERPLDDNVQRLADVTLVFFGQALDHHS